MTVSISGAFSRDSQNSFVGLRTIEPGKSSQPMRAIRADAQLADGRERNANPARAHLAYVAIDEHGRPRPLPSLVQPEGAEEERLHAKAHARKEARLRRMAERRDRPPSPEAVPHGLESWRIVFPEDAISAGIMFAG